MVTQETQDRLDRIWKNHKDGKPPVENSDCQTKGDGTDFIKDGDRLWERAPGERDWTEVPPLGGNI